MGLTLHSVHAVVLFMERVFSCRAGRLAKGRPVPSCGGAMVKVL